MDTVNTSFVSNKRYERIDIKRGVTITASGLGGAQNIVHGLGYVPFFRLFLKYPGRTFYEPLVQSPIDQGNYTDYEVKTGTIDTQKIEVLYLNNTANPDPSITVYYRIYAEPQE